jgi:hypothetical protein
MKSITFEDKEGYTQNINPLWIEYAEIKQEMTQNKPYWSVRVHIIGKVEYHSRPFRDVNEAQSFYEYIVECINSIS